MILRLSPEVGRVYRRLLGYVRPHRRVIFAAVAVTAAYAGLSGVVPFFLSGVIEQLLSDVERGQGSMRIPVLIAIVFALRGAMDFLTVYGLSWVGRSVIRDLRTELFGHYLMLPASFYDRTSTGTLISTLTYNTEQVAEAISNAIVILVRDSLQIVVFVGVMIYWSPQLTLIIAVVGPLVGLLVAYMSKAFRRYSSRIQNSMGDVTRLTEQSLQGHRIVKIFEGQAHEQAQFDAVNARNFRLNLRLAAVRSLGDSLTQYVVALGVAAIIFLVLSDWILAELTAPIFVGFITAMGMLLAPLKRLININVAVQRGIAAAESLFLMLDEPLEAGEGRPAPARARGRIEYRNVSFRYSDEPAPVIDDLSFEVEAGTTVAIVGRSGSGKSTLVGLLPRFYEVSSGVILLDGQDIRGTRLRDLRRQLSFVSQEVVLFDDTIANNIAYGALADSPRSAIERAAEAAHVTEFSAQLPNGLDTAVGERGSLLSGGQRQRVAIARALLKDAPVLILDEATSALDTESERSVQQALGQLMRARTTLVIAHRLSTVENADRIIAMKEGRLVESGTHAELMDRDGYYSMLHRMQFAD
jgi:subfamily B ATP-binding cassette protein MsbA